MKGGSNRFNLASALLSSSASTTPTIPDCKSQYQIQKDITSVSSATFTSAQAKAKQAELEYNTKKSTYAKRISDLNTGIYTQKTLLLKVPTQDKKKRDTVTKALKKFQTDLQAVTVTWQKIVQAYVDNPVVTLPSKEELTKQLDTFTNPTTGLIALMKKKKSCPAQESSGFANGNSAFCADNIDNDMKGKTDCKDAKCSLDVKCTGKDVNTTPGTPDTTTITLGNNSNTTSGTCSDSQYTTKNSCEAIRTLCLF
jgi:hypothetical protein